MVWVVTSFSFPILLAWAFLFFLDESGERFVNFVYLFKEPAISFIDLFHRFFSLYFIYFCSDLFLLLFLLCVPFKSGVSISHSPLAPPKISPAGLQSQAF